MTVLGVFTISRQTPEFRPNHDQRFALSSCTCHPSAA
jgi:hypothetical protein